MIEEEQPFPEQRLRAVFEELGQGCSKFVSLVKGTGGGSAAGKTKLDKERHKLLVREMVRHDDLSQANQIKTRKMGKSIRSFTFMFIYSYLSVQI